MNMMLFTEIFFFVIEKIYLRLIENGLVLILKEKKLNFGWMPPHTSLFIKIIY